MDFRIRFDSPPQEGPNGNVLAGTLLRKGTVLECFLALGTILDPRAQGLCVPSWLPRKESLCFTFLKNPLKDSDGPSKFRGLDEPFKGLDGPLGSAEADVMPFDEPSVMLRELEVLDRNDDVTFAAQNPSGNFSQKETKCNSWRPCALKVNLVYKLINILISLEYY